MNNITSLTGTDTFETWFNRTNTIISELNNADPRVVSVRDYGAVGNGITDDYTPINNALNAAMAITGPGGILFFPRGNYLMGQTRAAANDAINKNLTAPLVLLGNEAKIICGVTCQEFWYIKTNNNNLTVNGLQFDGNQKGQYLFRVDENGLTSSNTLDVRNCAFNNSYSYGGFPDKGNAGAYFCGGLEYVSVTNTKVQNHSRDKVGTSGSAGSVGIAIQRNSTVPPPKNVTVTDCFFSEVSSGWTGYDITNNVDCDCLSVFGIWGDARQGTTYSTTQANITNNHFKNCKGRSIKIQTDHAIIENNNIYRDISCIARGFVDINAQITVGKINNNQFWYKPTTSGKSPFSPDGGLTGSAYCIGTYTNTGFNRSRSISIENNTVKIDVPISVGRLYAFFDTSRSASGSTGALFANIRGNHIVGGPIRFFGSVGTYSISGAAPSPDTSSTYYNITDNMIEEINDTEGVSYAFLYSSDYENYNQNNFNISNNIVHKGNPVKHLISSSSNDSLITLNARVSAWNNRNIGVTLESFQHATNAFVPRLGFITDDGGSTASSGGVISTQTVRLPNNSGYYAFPKRGVDFAGKVRLLTANDGKDCTFMFIQHGTSTTHTPIGLTGASVAMQPNTSSTTANKLNVALVNGDVAIANTLGAARNFTLTTFG